MNQFRSPEISVFTNQFNSQRTIISTSDFNNSFGFTVRNCIYRRFNSFLLFIKKGYFGHLQIISLKNLRYMNQQFSTLKKAIEVFHTYGITLAGPRKNDHFITNLNMDPIFINGLIFELEYQLQVFIK
jgi:hypothetical protein